LRVGGGPVSNAEDVRAGGPPQTERPRVWHSETCDARIESLPARLLSIQVVERYDAVDGLAQEREYECVVQYLRGFRHREMTADERILL
jgi:hypothetical protein